MDRGSLVASVCNAQDLASRAYLITLIRSDAITSGYPFFDGNPLFDGTVLASNTRTSGTAGTFRTSLRLGSTPGWEDLIS